MFDEKKINKSCYISSRAYLSGRITVGALSSVWPFASIRGDLNKINIGKGTNIQDSCTLHVTKTHGVEIGNYCTIGHGAVVHGAAIENNCIIGMNATVLDGALIKEGSIVGANALVTEKSSFSPYSLIVGVPAKAIKILPPETFDKIKANAETYIKLAKSYKTVED
ncbi:MAG: gamma carbonic anhydrase family protein [Candidatus Methanofastidiosia archaeon]